MGNIGEPEKHEEWEIEPLQAPREAPAEEPVPDEEPVPS